MKTTGFEVKNFAISSYAVFENGEFITTNNSFDELMQRATVIAGEKVNNKSTIATLKFTGTDENPTVEEGVVIMSFTNIGGTVYIVNRLIEV